MYLGVFLDVSRLTMRERGSFMIDAGDPRHHKLVVVITISLSARQKDQPRTCYRLCGAGVYGKRTCG